MVSPARTAVAILAICLAGSMAWAEVITWGGSSLKNWDVAANWTLNGTASPRVPTTGDTAVIASGAPIADISLSPAPDLIRIDSGGTLRCGTALTNSLVGNGGTLGIYGSSSPVLTSPIQLTSNFTITNPGTASGYPTLSGVISEDGMPRQLIVSGTSASLPTANLPHVVFTAVNTYSGGTVITGDNLRLSNLSALGSGPVSLQDGILELAVNGSYTFGKLTMTGGALQLDPNVNPTNANWDLRGGTIIQSWRGGPNTLASGNTITVGNTVNIASAGYTSNPLTIGTTITGGGKVVLNDYGLGQQYKGRVTLTAVQSWTGGTDIKGQVFVSAGGALPGGTVTVAAVNPAWLPTSGADMAVLELFNSSALDPATDLVLGHDTVNNWYGTLRLAASETVHSLTIDGQFVTPGVYTAAMLPSYLLNSDGYTLTVTAPEPATLSLLLLSGLGLLRRRGKHCSK